MKDDLFHIVNGAASEGAALRRGLSDQVADALRIEIFSGNLQIGSRLNETDVSKRLGISRGPVRDAIRLLDNEGLLESDWHKGAFVKDLTLSHAIEIYTLRTVIERLAVERAIAFRTGEDLALLRKRAEEIEQAAALQDQTDMLLADIAFHQQIYLSAHHQLLFNSWASLRSQIAFVLLQRRESTSQYKRLIIQEHWDLYEAIRTQDRELAVGMVEEHIASAFERLRDKLYPIQLAEDSESMR